MFKEPLFTAAIIPSSSLTGIKAPLRPPTFEDAIIPPFFTASFKSASAAVVPWAPQLSSPISSKILATLSPISGVGAKDRSIMPNGIFILSAISLAITSPALVILNAVFLIVSHTVSKSSPFIFSKACFTTPGPLTPTLKQVSDSPVP